MNIQDIQCVQTNGAAWLPSGKPATKCQGAISLQKTDADGNFLTTYKYFSTTADVPAAGWYYDNGGSWTWATETFTEGEGMILQNTHSVGASFVISGEVDLDPAIVLPKKLSFSGNFTPCSMTLGDIRCVQVDGSEWLPSGKPATKCQGAVSLQKTDEDGNFLTTYKYFSTTADVPTAGWYYDNAGSWVSAANIPFASGEGFLVQNTHSVGAKLILKKPIED